MESLYVRVNAQSNQAGQSAMRPLGPAGAEIGH